MHVVFAFDVSDERAMWSTWPECRVEPRDLVHDVFHCLVHMLRPAWPNSVDHVDQCEAVAENDELLGVSALAHVEFQNQVLRECLLLRHKQFSDHPN